MSENSRGAKRGGWFREFVLPIGIGVLVALCLRQWVLGLTRVPSASMYPTIPAINEQHESFVLMNKLATEFRPIHRGEVVVFHWPDNPSMLFVKRVIGLPGDTVTVTQTAVYINGKLLQETNPGIAKSNGYVTGTYHVPKGHYFMLGDNRTISDDSRSWTHKYVASSAIVGEAEFVLWPLNKMSHISQHV